ncbi:C2 calcium-dependent membrane targeting [Cynara cardunculus var. scolymus]|uniref:C2 calcium-dependent membrane targeting n=1 Tax=Cynara cardunculus var. scolymus TaxID=59895 RepID=A0A103YDY2_CYNCS|nr:C2 calcium-dependent membrane targeting [Cynara cardunculus var. scolymus]
MGVVSTILGAFGFGIGVSLGLVIGYYFFIYFQSSHVENPKIRPLVERDSKSLQQMLPEIPMWVKNPDHDRVDWLNKFVELMWPYLDKTIAEPIIKEQIPKYKIDAVEFDSLTLGDLPPTFQGMKVYTTDEKELIMEPSFKWAGNPNIHVAVKAFGAMKRPVGMLNVKVLRAMKLKKKDFMGASDPYVKLKLTEEKLPSKKTSVKHKNLNPEWNEEFNMVVKDPELQALEIVVYDWEQVGKHDKMGMNVIPLKEVTPEEPKVMTLELLKNMDPNDAQNEKSRGQIMIELVYKPFADDKLPAEAEDGNMIEKAPEGTPEGGGLLVPVKKNRDPRWDEEFAFTLEEPPTNDRMHFEVVSTSSRMGLIHPKESLGYVDIHLGDVVSNKRINEKYNLIDSKNGKLLVEMQWRTSS